MATFKTLLLAHHAGEDLATRIAVNQFAERVAERSGGLLNIANAPGGALGDIPALLRMVIKGKVDMALPPHDRLGALIPKFGCVSTPFIFDDLAHADRVIEGPFSDWAMPDLLQQGLHCLSNWEWGFRQFTNSRRPLLTPADMQGLKIRVPPILQYQEAILALGAMPVVVEFAKLGSVLRQGIVDGQENPVAIIRAHMLHETQAYMSLLNYSYGGMVHIINRKTLDDLSSEHQQIIREESLLASRLMRQTARSQELSQIDELRDLGMQIDKPDPAPFKARTKTALTHLSKAFGEVRLGTFLEMVDFHRGDRVQEHRP